MAVRRAEMGPFITPYSISRREGHSVAKSIRNAVTPQVRTLFLDTPLGYRTELFDTREQVSGLVTVEHIKLPRRAQLGPNRSVIEVDPDQDHLVIHHNQSRGYSPGHEIEIVSGEEINQLEPFTINKGTRTERTVIFSSGYPGGRPNNVEPRPDPNPQPNYDEIDIELYELVNSLQLNPQS